MTATTTRMTELHKAALLDLLGEQPLCHLLVNPVIQGALARAWPVQAQAQDTDNTVLRSLRNWWNGDNQPISWPHRHLAGGHLRVLDFGFDLSNRPAWLRATSSVSYLGFRLPDRAATSDGNVRPCDWTRLTAATLRDEIRQAWSIPHGVIHALEASDLKSHELPNWILAVDVLNHLEDPRSFLRAVAHQYCRPTDTGHMLVVTRNAAFFNKKVNAVTLPDAEYLHSRGELRRAFRDAGLTVLDEFSPALPLLSPERSARDFPSAEAQTALAKGMPPLHFWVLRLNCTRAEPATAKELEAWLAELVAAENDHKEAGRKGFYRYASARLTLETLLKPKKDASGLELPVDLGGLVWRQVASNHPLVTARNTGGRLFIIRKGVSIAYHPEPPKIVANADSSQPTPPPPWRVRRGQNELVGELELFDQGDELADRTYLWSLFAPKPPSQQSTGGDNVVPPVIGTVALEISARLVQRLLRARNVLNNPFLRDLRSKSLEAELGVRLGLKFYFAPKTNRKKDPETPAAEPRPPSVEFYGRLGPRKVSRLTVAQVAALLERAVEHDREWGLPEGPQGRTIVFTNLHRARMSMYANDGTGSQDTNTTSAIQFLERSGAIRALTMSSHVLSAANGLPPKDSREQVTTSMSAPDAKAFAADLERRAKKSSQEYDTWFLGYFGESPPQPSLEALVKKQYPKEPLAYDALKNAFLGAPQYVVIVIRSEYLLRRFAMDLAGPMLEDLSFARETLPFPSPDDLKDEDLLLVQMGIHHLYQRTQARLAHIDSMGLRVFKTSDADLDDGGLLTSPADLAH